MDAVNPLVCPKFDHTDCLKTMMKVNYGLTVTHFKSLTTYLDCNYHIQVEENYSNDNITQICPHGYLLKILNFMDSKDPDFVLGQNLVIDAIQASGIKCQEDVKTVDGELFSRLTHGENGKAVNYMVFVRTFIPGVILNSVSLTKSLCFQVGKLTADISKALESFHFDFYDNDVKRTWNLDNFLSVKDVLHAVKDERRREIAEQVLRQFESKVIPRKDEFRKGQIHGDMNAQNILVKQTDEGFQICGLLDFQDTADSFCVYDVAMAMAYTMMVHESDVPVIDVGGHLIAGYLSVCSLNQAEKDSLKIVAAGRMVMSLVYCAYSYTLDPSNKYILTTGKVGWSHLVKFWNTSEQTIWNRWNEIINSYEDKSESLK